MILLGLILQMTPSIECDNLFEQNHQVADSVMISSMGSGISIGYQWSSHPDKGDPFGANVNLSQNLFNADLSLNHNGVPFWGAGIGLGSAIQLKFRSDFDLEHKSVGIFYDVPFMTASIIRQQVSYMDPFGVSFSLSHEITPKPQWIVAAGFSFDLVKLSAVRYLKKFSDVPELRIKTYCGDKHNQKRTQ